MPPRLTAGFDHWQELTPTSCPLMSMYRPGHVHTERVGGQEERRNKSPQYLLFKSCTQEND